jgi:hypothetical protein
MNSVLFFPYPKVQKRTVETLAVPIVRFGMVENEE